MLRKLRERMESERGFTLIELLVVILIIGILAAIALPAFLGQRQKGQDADAKSNARNLVSHTESWYSTNQSYTGAAASPDVTNSGLPLGGGQGQVEITSANGDNYTIVGHSKSGTDFTMTKVNGGPVTRTCSNPNQGGCDSTGHW